LPVSWPFCFWIAAVVDLSRARSSPRRRSARSRQPPRSAPYSAAPCNPQGAPPHIVSDQGAQFQREYLDWCRRHGAKPRFGALGERGSIALIERSWRSMKQECFRRVSVVTFAHAAIQVELDAYTTWYNEHRPHRALGGRTPSEVRDELVPASERPALEPRARFPLVPRAGPARLRRRLRGRIELSRTRFRERAHLPIVERPRAA
jgi:transposase InsO family protein